MRRPEKKALGKLERRKSLNFTGCRAKRKNDSMLMAVVLLFADLYHCRDDSCSIHTSFHGKLHIAFGRAEEFNIMDQFVSQGGIHAGGKVLPGVLTDLIIQRIPVLGLTANDNSYLIAGADAVGHHALVLRKKPVACDPAERRIFCFDRVVVPGIGKERIARTIRLL